MNNWDDRDNLPPDDEDPDFGWLDNDDDLSWLDEGPESEKPSEWQMPRTSRAERDISDRMQSAEDADFGDTGELLDWMADPVSGHEESPDDDDLAWMSSTGGHDDEPDNFPPVSSAAHDDDDLSWMSAAAGADDEEDSFFSGLATDDEQGMPSSRTAEPEESGNVAWGDLGAALTGEFGAVPDKPAPASSEWSALGKAFTDEFEAIPDDEPEQAGPDGPSWLMDDLELDDDWSGPSVMEPAPSRSFADLFSDEEPLKTPGPADVPDYLSDFAAELEPEPVELDDHELLAELASADEDDFSDLLADLGDEDTDTDDLLADLAGLEDVDDVDLDDLLADLDEVDDEDTLLAELAGMDEEDDLDNLLLSIEPDDIPLAKAEVPLDFMADLEAEPDAIGDFFSELEEEAEPAGELDFLGQFEEEEAEPAGELDFLESEPAAYVGDEESEADWLSVLDTVDLEQEEEPAQPAVDLDSLLESLEERQISTPREPELQPVNLDDFFAAQQPERAETSMFSEDVPTGELPDWLLEAAASVDESSAAAVIRSRRNRSLEELDERLLELRERGLEISADSSEPEDSRQRMRKVVPNVKDALVPAQVRSLKVELPTAPMLAPEQVERAAFLRELVGASVGAGRVAALEGEAISAPTESRAAERRRRAWLRIDRLLVALFLLAIVLIPFVLPQFQIGDQPPREFIAGSAESAAFFRMESLQPEERVLVALEYGASGARELDLMTETLLTHLLNSGARPVIVSSNVVALLRGEAILADLAGADSYNQDYYVAAFLPGGSIGLRDLAVNTGRVLAINSQGRSSGLQVTSLNDFSLVILVAESGETVRDWMEQVIPATNRGVIVATGQSAYPVALPYVDSNPGVIALLTGYRDAVTWQQMSIAFNNPQAQPTAQPVTEIPTEPTDANIEATAEVTAEVPVVVATATDAPATATTEAAMATTEPPTATTEAATDTPEPPTATDVPPTDTPEPPTATDVPPTNTPEPTATPLPPVEVAFVATDSAVNVRSGAGTTFSIAGTLQPQQRVRIIGRNDDGSWLQIVLPDGTEGWVAAFLVETELIPADEWDGAQVVLRVFARRIREVQQDATPDLVTVGRNVSGVTINVFANADLSGDPVAQISPNTQFIVLEAGNPAVRVLLEDGTTIGFVEMRLIRVEEVLREEVPFAPTQTPTPTPSHTPTITPTPTNTATPTPTLTPTATPFVPQVLPQPVPAGDARWNAMTLGILATLFVIVIGNLFWIIRWWRQRG